MAKTINLKICGPIPILEFLGKKVDAKYDKPGVYFWIEQRPPNTDKILSYIGKSETSIAARNRFHAIGLVSGIYSVPKEFFGVRRNQDHF